MFFKVTSKKWYTIKRLSGFYAALKIHELVNSWIRGFVFLCHKQVNRQKKPRYFAKLFLRLFIYKGIIYFSLVGKYFFSNTFRRLYSRFWLIYYISCLETLKHTIKMKFGFSLPSLIWFCQHLKDYC